MRAQDIAFDRKVRKVATEVAESITALPTTWTAADVVAIWRARTESLQLLSYAYVDLDATYTRFPDYTVWHPRLRSTRNDPEHGPAMFAAIRKEKA